MKKIMEKQWKKILLWGFKGILSVTLSSLAVIAFAQGADVCQGTVYTIADAIPASAGSEYRWLENGGALSGTNQATYNVPANKAAGVYTYVRQSKSAECPDWQSSNEFTVTVFACSFTAGTATGSTATFTDPRDGKRYKTVVMPDGRTWFAQNLNYTKDLTFNKYANEANGKPLTVPGVANIAIGSYWCPALNSNYSGDQNTCNIFGALYTWETAMLVDGKYADATKTSSVWDESWVSPYYTNSAPPNTPNADKNNGRGGSTAKGGGRGICPESWHVPTLYEWAVMLDAVEGNTTFTQSPLDDAYRGTQAGQLLKYAGTYTASEAELRPEWLNDAYPGTDQYAFRALPSGGRTSAGYNFVYLGMHAYWISSSVASKNYGHRVYLSNDQPGAVLVSNTYSWGQAIRCIKD